MTEYLVRWEINIEADSFEEAAEKALEIQRNPLSIATVFDVSYTDGGMSGCKRVDLLEK